MRTWHGIIVTAETTPISSKPATTPQQYKQPRQKSFFKPDYRTKSHTQRTILEFKKLIQIAEIPKKNKQSVIEPKIINISNTDLTKSEIKLLKRGLKFTPIPRENQKELEADLHEFARKLRETIRTFQRQAGKTTNSLVWNTSNFVPPRSNNRELNTR